MFTYFEFDEIPSTNEWLKERASDLNHGAVCHALSQSHGRGRGGNKWLSTKGNLYCSLLLKPNHKMSLGMAGLVSFVTSLALYDVLETYIGPSHEITLKWPNDVLIDGAKVSGILLETEKALSGNSTAYLVVGFGVNVEYAPEINDKKTICLKDALTTNSDINLITLRDQILNKIMTYFDLFLTRGFSPIRNVWIEKCAFIGQDIRIRTNQEVFTACFETIDEKGLLIAKMSDGTIKEISSAEVFF